MINPKFLYPILSTSDKDSQLSGPHQYVERPMRASRPNARGLKARLPPALAKTFALLKERFDSKRLAEFALS